MLRYISCLLWIACSSTQNGVTGEPVPGNPLGVDESALPFPSSTYLVEDSSSPTGFRVEIDSDHLPKPTDGTVIE